MDLFRHQVVLMYLGNIYLHCTYIAMSPGILKRNKEDYMGGLGWKKKRKWCDYIIITKNKRNLKISIKEKHEVTIKLRGAQASQGLYNPIDCDHGLWSWWTTNSWIWEKMSEKPDSSIIYLWTPDTIWNHRCGQALGQSFVS